MDEHHAGEIEVSFEDCITLYVAVVYMNTPLAPRWGAALRRPTIQGSANAHTWLSFVVALRRQFQNPEPAIWSPWRRLPRESELFRRCSPLSYSLRAVIGLIRVARRAGSKQARKPARHRANTLLHSATGSLGDTWNKMLLIK
jgi:hypothetical protein